MKQTPLRGWKKRAVQIYEGFPGVNTLSRQSYLLLISLLLLSAIGFITAYTLEIISIDIVFWLFLIVGVGTLPIGLGVSIYHIACYRRVKKYFSEAVTGDSNTPENLTGIKTDYYLGKYFSSLPNQIMSLGVIPLILGIISIILEEYQPAVVVINGNVVNVVTTLMLVGAFAEAIAFLFGFLFPEADGYSYDPGHDEIADQNTGVISSDQSATIDMSSKAEKADRLTKEELREVLTDLTNNISIRLESK